MIYRLNPVFTSLIILISIFSLKSEIHAQTKNGRKVSFHPSVGNSISVDEKKQFGLFPEYTDSLFKSAELISDDTITLSIVFTTTSGQTFEKVISEQERDEIYKKIELISPFESVVEHGDDDYVVKKEDAGDKIKRKDHSAAVLTAVEITLNVLFVFLEVLVN